jgi:hypothetical protein
VLLLGILLPGSSKAQGDYLVFALVPPTWTVNLEFTYIDKAEALVASMHFAIQIDGAPQRECGLANEHGWIGKSNATVAAGKHTVAITVTQKDQQKPIVLKKDLRSANSGRKEQRRGWDLVRRRHDWCIGAHAQIRDALPQRLNSRSALVATSAQNSVVDASAEIRLR